MKRIFLVLFILFMTVGCSKGESVTCNIDGKEAIFTLKEGIITGYKLDGQNQSQSEIDELNGTYFTSSTDNEEGKATLRSYVSKIGGICSYD